MQIKVKRRGLIPKSNFVFGPHIPAIDLDEEYLESTIPEDRSALKNPVNHKVDNLVSRKGPNNKIHDKPRHNNRKSMILESELKGLLNAGIEEEDINRFSDGLYLTHNKVVTLRDAYRQRLESRIRQATKDGDILIRKALELALGIRVERGNGVIYRSKPDLKAIKLLLEYGYGVPLSTIEIKPSDSGNQQNLVQIFLPDNNRNDGPKLDVKALPGVIDSEFVEEE